jgi:hypothetical protein
MRGVSQDLEQFRVVRRWQLRITAITTEYTGDHREKTGNCGNLVKPHFGVRFVYVDDLAGRIKFGIFPGK